jgi:hypothetical protein
VLTSASSRLAVGLRQKRAAVLAAQTQRVRHARAGGGISRKAHILYPCPCCGYLVFREPTGSYAICPICFWEDDASALRFADEGGGVNEVSLRQAQANYAAAGVSDNRLAAHVRAPQPGEVRDPLWRPLDPERDEVETLVGGVDYGGTYPSNPTDLYYWRR